MAVIGDFNPGDFTGRNSFDMNTAASAVTGGLEEDLQKIQVEVDVAGKQDSMQQFTENWLDAFQQIKDQSMASADEFSRILSASLSDEFSKMS